MCKPKVCLYINLDWLQLKFLSCRSTRLCAICCILCHLCFVLHPLIYIQYLFKAILTFLWIKAAFDLEIDVARFLLLSLFADLAHNLFTCTRIRVRIRVDTKTTQYEGL